MGTAGAQSKDLKFSEKGGKARVKEVRMKWKELEHLVSAPLSLSFSSQGRVKKVAEIGR